MRAAPRWERYEQCPICWRNWDCRQMRRGSLMREGTYLGVWMDKPLRRPHLGRRQRGAR